MDTLPLFDPSRPPSAFDYQAMDPNAARDARAAVERYRSRQKAYVIDTGRDLLAIKAQLEHGLFLEWVQSEIGMTPRSAQRAMAAAEVLGDKSDTVSYLPPTVLYELSAPSTPEPVRAAVLRRIEAGEAVRAETILDEVREGRGEARKQASAAKEAARRAALSPEERAKEDAKNKRQKRSLEAEEREREERRAQRLEEAAVKRTKADEAAAILLDALGVEVAALFCARYGGIAADVLGRLGASASTKRAKSIEPIVVATHEVRDDRWGNYGSHYWDDEAAVRELAEQIRQDSLKEPITVAINDLEPYGKYRVIDGSRRLRAFGLLGLREITARVIAPVTLDD